MKKARDIIQNGNDIDLTPDSIASEVSREENGIASCRLSAQNTDGVTVLTKILMNDEIVVNYSDDDGNLVEYFRGNVIERIPSLSNAGQIVEIECAGKGYCTKLVRINTEYGQIYPQVGSNSNEAWSYVDPISDYHFPDYHPLEILVRSDDCSIGPSGAGNSSGVWTIGAGKTDFPYVYNINPFIRNYADSTETGGGLYTKGITCSVDKTVTPGDYIGIWTFEQLPPTYNKIIPTKLNLCLAGLKVATGSKFPHYIMIKFWYSVNGGATWLSNEKTFDNYSGTPQIVKADILSDVISYDNINSLQVKLQLSGYILTDEDAEAGYLHLGELYLELVSVHEYWNEGNTIQQIVAGIPTDPDSLVIGSAEVHSNTLLDLLAEPFPGITSGWSLDGSKIPNASPSLIPYIFFPYLDVFSCINDLIRDANAVEYLSNPSDWRGLHWTVMSSGGTDYLLIDKIGSHSTDVEALWASECPMNPIVVKQDMIMEKFQTKMPLANMVLIGGTFRNPANDDYTEQSRFNDYNTSADTAHAWCYQDGAPWSNCELDSETYTVRSSSIHFHKGSIEYPAQEEAYWTHTLLKTVDGTYTLIDFFKLMGKDAKPTIRFYMMADSIASVKLRLYSQVDRSGIDADESYFEANISHFIGDVGEWVKCEVSIPNDIIGNMSTGWTAHGDADWSKINRIGFFINVIASALPVVGNVRIDGLTIEGPMIRGMYSSSSITATHLRIAPPMKNTMADKDTTDADEMSSPLSQFALSELTRYMSELTTGTIKVPLNPHIKEGQLVEIISENYPEIPTIVSGEGIDNASLETWTDQYTAPGWSAASKHMYRDSNADSLYWDGNPDFHPHSGIYCCRLYDIEDSLAGSAIQVLDNPIPVDDVTVFSFWIYKHATGSDVLHLRIQYCDLDGSNVTTPYNYVQSLAIADTWVQKDLMSSIASHTGKAIYSVEMINPDSDNGSGHLLRIDDFLLTYTITTIYSGTQFRINKVVAKYNKSEASSELTLTSDIYNSLPVAFDPYSIFIRVTSPDVQNKTFTSIRNMGGDFDPKQPPLLHDVG